VAPARNAPAAVAETAVRGEAAAPQEPATRAEAADVDRRQDPASTQRRVTGVEPVAVRQADASTVRPPARPDRLARPEPARDRPRQKEPTRSAAAAAAGNAERSARRGDAQGTREAEATRAATTAARPSAESGRAAANYGGRVLRQIASTRKERVRSRGVAVVGFRIGDGGQLVSARVLRSSGARELDRAALDHIRRAAPFPPPPAGAARSFSFEFAGR
ncbi:energy transducer TonB, partial [Rhodosalinus halophilus]|uniref:energy transducer TonB n=1 Tax=Rhodosalinus halophilus TaxID=2259333 RepID=UPI001314A40C